MQATAGHWQQGKEGMHKHYVAQLENLTAVLRSFRGVGRNVLNLDVVSLCTGLCGSHRKQLNREIGNRPTVPAKK